MNIIQCPNCGRYIHKAPGCYHCATALDTQESPAQKGSIAEGLQRTQSLVEREQYDAVLEESDSLLRWEPELSGIFWLRLLARKRCSSTIELLSTGFSWAEDPDFSNALRYAEGPEREACEDLRTTLEAIREALKDALPKQAQERKRSTSLPELKTDVEAETERRKEKLFSLWSEVEKAEQRMLSLESDARILMQEHHNALEAAERTAKAIRMEAGSMEGCPEEYHYAYQLRLDAAARQCAEARQAIEELRQNPIVREFADLETQRLILSMEIDGELAALRRYISGVRNTMKNVSQIDAEVRDALERAENFDFTAASAFLGDDPFCFVLRTAGVAAGVPLIPAAPPEPEAKTEQAAEKEPEREMARETAGEAEKGGVFLPESKRGPLEGDVPSSAHMSASHHPVLLPLEEEDDEFEYALIPKRGAQSVSGEGKKPEKAKVPEAVEQFAATERTETEKISEAMEESETPAAAAVAKALAAEGRLEPAELPAARKETSPPVSAPVPPAEVLPDVEKLPDSTAEKRPNVVAGKKSSAAKKTASVPKKATAERMAAAKKSTGGSSKKKSVSSALAERFSISDDDGEEALPMAMPRGAIKTVLMEELGYTRGDAASAEETPPAEKSPAAPAAKKKDTPKKAASTAKRTPAVASKAPAAGKQTVAEGRKPSSAGAKRGMLSGISEELKRSAASTEGDYIPTLTDQALASRNALEKTRQDVEALREGKELYQQGLAFFQAKGTERKLLEAVQCFRKSAEFGIADAQNMLGYCYFNGQGVVQDFNQAAYWYRKAAEQGNAGAQNDLGLCYFNGKGVQADRTQAAFWFRQSAEQGNAAAQNSLGYCYFKGEGLQPDNGQAVYWYRKAADQGNAGAQNNLANSYYYGDGVEQDFRKAAFWYGASAKQGYADAQTMLGFCYLDGQGVKQDDGQAIAWFLLAAEQGDDLAQFQAGDCYRNGIGVGRNPQQAVVWFRRSAAQGNEDAQEALKELGFS